MKFIDSVMCNFTGDGGLHNLVLDELMGASGISRDELNEAEIISKQQPWTHRLSCMRIRIIFKSS